MKKIKILISGFLAAMVLVSAAAFSASADIIYIRGDANSDGRVNINDVTYVQRVIAQSESDLQGVVERNCDVDGNGLSIVDATHIQRYIAMLANPYQIGKQFHYDEYELPFIPTK